jgi:hypothetical protein
MASKLLKMNWLSRRQANVHIFAVACLRDLCQELNLATANYVLLPDAPAAGHRSIQLVAMPLTQKVNQIRTQALPRSCRRQS